MPRIASLCVLAPLREQSVDDQAEKIFKKSVASPRPLEVN
jgi:hypothetical protein